MRRDTERDCPKSMVFGPCGGVSRDDACEVDSRPCPFLDREMAVFEARCHPRLDSSAPRVWADFRPDPTTPREVEEAARHLRDAGVGVLVGEHVDDPTPHRPSVVGRLLVDSGLEAITTVVCRARSATALEEEIEALVAVGPYAIHCVTGDHPAARLGIDDEVEFGLDGTELAAMARRKGARVSVAESPASPPVELRPLRLLSKQNAGADLVILNHAGTVDSLQEFAADAGDAGVTMSKIAPVPVITDRRSAESLARFPGLELPPGLVQRVLAAPDPAEEGVSAAAEMAVGLLRCGLFSGVNLSGSARDGDLVNRAAVMAQVAEEIRSRFGSDEARV